MRVGHGPCDPDSMPAMSLTTERSTEGASVGDPAMAKHRAPSRLGAVRSRLEGALETTKSVSASLWNRITRADQRGKPALGGYSWRVSVVASALIWPLPAMLAHLFSRLMLLFVDDVYLAVLILKGERFITFGGGMMLWLISFFCAMEALKAEDSREISAGRFAFGISVTATICYIGAFFL